MNLQPQHRKKTEETSYQPLEELLKRSSFESSAPRADFRQELLASLKATRRAPKETFMTRVFRLAYLPATLAILTLLVAGGGIYLTRKTATPIAEQPIQITDIKLDPADVPGILTLKPTENTDVGIAATTAFVLETKQAFSVEQIRKSLAFSGKIPYSISKNAANTYLIKPVRALSEGVLVLVDMPVTYTTLTGEAATYAFSWAFQVQETFQAVSTLPRHQATSVPNDTGVEVEFSHAGFTGYEENFSILPKTSGRFEVHDKTLSFIPEKPLTFTTLYTVTIGKDLKLPATGETLGRDIVFQFETVSPPEEVRGTRPYFQKLSNESSVTDAPALVVFGNEKDEEVSVVVYAFPSEDAFRTAFAETQALPTWSWHSNQTWMYPTDGLARDQSFETTLKGDRNGPLYLEFPKPLSRGYYLVSMKSTDGNDVPERQTLLQISNLTAYSTVSDSDTLVWLHDAQTKKPISNANITLFDGTKLDTSDEKGLATFPTPDVVRKDLSETASSYIVKNGPETLYLTVRLQPNYYMESAFWGGDRPVDPIRSEYWNYLYLNQPMYQPTDTVKFWGVVRHRKNPESEKLNVRLYENARWIMDDRIGTDRVPLASTTVTTDETGMFQGELPLDRLFPGAYSLEVSLDDQFLNSEIVRVETYTKPAYQLEIASNVAALFSGDRVDYTIRSTFFEGTPLPNLPIKFAYNKDLTTDETGTATTSETYSAESYDRYLGPTVQPAREEEGEIAAEKTVRVFASQHDIRVDSSEVENNTAEIRGNLLSIDLGPYNRNEVSIYAEPTGSPVPNAKIEMRLTKTWYETIQTGTRYNYIQKKVTPVYRYESHEELVTTATPSTDKDGNFTQKFTVDEKFNYLVEISSTDSKGRKRIETVAIRNFEPYYRFNENQALTLQMDVPMDGYALGSRVEAELWQGEQKLPDAKDSEPYLFQQLQSGIQEYATTGASTYAFTFSENDIPNIVLQAVWFDGRSYQVSQSVMVIFKSTDRKLTVTATPDQENYGAGDHVKLAIETKDAQGKPRSASVNVNLVDVALYQLRDQNLNFLSELYRIVDDGVLTTAASHEYPNNQMAFREANGRGGGGPRSVFKDAPVFQTVRTGNDGAGTLEFDLPDNLTTWRATLHGYTSDLYAGTGTGSIVVKQPFFVDGIIAKSFHKNDQPEIQLRTYGDQLKAGQAVKIVVSSETLPMEATTYTAKAFDRVDVKFPALSEGVHTLRIEATAGELSDTLIRTFTVIPSNFMLPKTTVENAAISWTPKVETDRNFRVLFVDQHIGQYFPALQNASYFWGDRLDDQLGRLLSVKLLNTYFSEEREVPSIEYTEYQNGTKGGLTLFPYSDDDLVLSAHVAATSESSAFNAGKLISYFDAVWKDETQTTLRRAQALYGLAGLGEPVLLDIRTMLASSEITDEDRLYLGLGLATLGDLDGARTVFNELQVTYGKTQDQYQWLALGDKQDQWLTATSLHAILAARIGDPSSDPLFNYVEDNNTTDVLLTLQKLIFLELRLPSLPQSTVNMEYSLGGETKNATLEDGRAHVVPLTSSTASGFAVTALEGKALAITEQTVPQDFNAVTKDANLKIQRNYVVNGKVTKTFSENDVVEVHLTVDIAEGAPDGSYQVVDLLPAGLKVVSQPWRWAGFRDQISHPYRVDGNTVSFWTNDGHTTIKYLARVTNKGTFIAEPAMLQSFNAPSARNITNTDTVTVR